MKFICFAFLPLFLLLSSSFADTLTVNPSKNISDSNVETDTVATPVTKDTSVTRKDIQPDVSTNDRDTINNLHAKKDESTAVPVKYEITGIVRDYYAKTPIAGANVNITGSSVTTQSKSDGTFSITPGSTDACTLIISAPGYSPDTVITQLSGDKVELPSVELKTNLQKMEKVVVVGKREGESDALNKQKNSDNLKNVVSSELIEKLPDHSTADALQRVSGVSLQRETGEGHYVQIRGTEPRLSTVTINGQDIAAPDGKTRAVALNVIPSDQLAEIEVSKVLTPEMNGDAIGGTVNLVTSTAKDKNFNIKLNLLPGYSSLSKQPIWQGSISAGKRFLDGGKLGIFMGGSYYKEERETDGIAMHWDSTVYKTLIPDSAINKAYGFLSNFQFLQSNEINERTGLNGKIDYRFSPVTNTFLSASYNTYNQHQSRYGENIAIDGGDSRPQKSDMHDVLTVNFDHSLKDRVKEQNITSITAGGNTVIQASKIDASVTWSNAQIREPDRVDISFDKLGNIKYSTDDPDNPQYLFFDLKKFNTTKIPVFKNAVFIHDTTMDDPNNYRTDGIQIENRNVHENTYSGQLNVTVPVNLSSNSIDIKMGVKAADHFKDQDVKYIKYIPAYNQKVIYPSLTYFLGDFSNDNFYNGKYKMGMMPDPQKVRSFFIPVPDSLIPDTTLKANSPNAECYQAEDRNVAGYVQAKLKSNPWLLIGGVRLEYTSMHYNGYGDSTLYIAQVYQFTKQVQMYKNFLFALPMILCKYSLNDQINIRSSFTRSFSRPNWYDLVPHTVQSYDDATGVTTKETGNPDLKPTTSDNVDLSFECYNSPKGLVSAGVFYKQMRNYIFSINTDEKPEGSKNPITTFSKKNGDIANLVGAELVLQQQFTFLPGYLEGFGVNCNYTYTWSGTTVPGFTQESALPGQSEHIGNFALFYEKYGFGARAALNYQTNFISEISSYTTRQKNEAFMYTFVDDHLQLDASLSQKIGKNFSVIIEFNNLTNEPYKIYIGDRAHMQEKEYYSWAMQGGVRMNF